MGSVRGDYGCFTKQTADKLRVTRSKLRRLTMALEKHGYIFSRNKTNQRVYYERDVQAIARLMAEMKKGKTIEYAAAEMCGKTVGVPDVIPGADVPDSVRQPSGPPETDITFSVEQLRLMIEQVAASTAEKTADRVIEKYDREMEMRIERRDRELVNRLREASETGRKKKGLLSKFFGKSRRFAER